MVSSEHIRVFFYFKNLNLNECVKTAENSVKNTKTMSKAAHCAKNCVAMNNFLNPLNVYKMT